MIKEEYFLSYNYSRGIPNWVGWQTNKDDLGDLSRSDDFREDNSLSKKCYKVDDSDYKGSGYDRGHLFPSGDRTKSLQFNKSKFLMMNMIAQHPVHNQEVWRELEEHARDLIEEGLTLYSFAGLIGQIKIINDGKITVPEYVWKVILIENRNGEVDSVIAVIMPKTNQ